MSSYLSHRLAGRRRKMQRIVHVCSSLRFELLEDRRVLSTSAPTETFLDPSSVFDDSAGASVAFPAIEVAPSGKDVKRYAILGDNLSKVEAVLAELEVAKIKTFKHFGGIAVKLTDSEARTLQATLGTDMRMVVDEPFQAIVEPETSQGKPGKKPGGGGGKQGQQVPWGITAVNAVDAWSVTRGSGVAVCVTDTGLDVDHPDLVTNIGAGANYIDGGSWNDDNGHGTHVGGTIAALDNSVGVVGVAPQATLLGAKFLDRRGRGTHTDAADAIYGCLDLRNEVDPTMTMPLVVNMSWSVGGTAEQREIVHSAIRDLTDQGVIFVGAVGNSNAGMVTPGRWPEVLVVTGVDEDLTFAPFSGWNTGLLPPPDTGILTSPLLQSTFCLPGKVAVPGSSTEQAWPRPMFRAWLH